MCVIPTLKLHAVCSSPSCLLFSVYARVTDTSPLTAVKILEKAFSWNTLKTPQCVCTVTRYQVTMATIHSSLTVKTNVCWSWGHMSFCLGNQICSICGIIIQLKSRLNLFILNIFFFFTVIWCETVGSRCLWVKLLKLRRWGGIRKCCFWPGNNYTNWPKVIWH